MEVQRKEAVYPPVAEQVCVEVCPVVAGRLVERVSLVEERSELRIEGLLVIADVQDVVQPDKTPFGR